MGGVPGRRRLLGRKAVREATGDHPQTGRSLACSVALVLVAAERHTQCDVDGLLWSSRAASGDCPSGETQRLHLTAYVQVVV